MGLVAPNSIPLILQVEPQVQLFAFECHFRPLAGVLEQVPHYQVGLVLELEALALV